MRCSFPGLASQRRRCRRSTLTPPLPEGTRVPSPFAFFVVQMTELAVPFRVIRQRFELHVTTPNVLSGFQTSLPARARQFVCS